MMKKHPCLDIWINGQEWLNTFEKLRHCRDMYSIKSGDVNFSGQPDSYIDWVQNTELPQLIKKDHVKNQVEKLLEEIDLKIINIDREKNAMVTSLDERKSKLLEQQKLYKDAIKVKKVKAKSK
ncbi:hypothetical protein EU99_1796 [Prochlorococcus marinus str. MIT 9321]|uniref:hypothetical protein n=2 Tax=Prochlorococcus TaxID=1218 RepID=UPI0005339487|nr:hypothetical protein [Prochlorococcus marinus]KGG02834.1 hypothetical protein EU99_1796 [Prochlorococcus marinus str. MIT 9321]